MMFWTRLVMLSAVGLGNVLQAELMKEFGVGECDDFPCANGGVCTDWVTVDDEKPRYHCRCNPSWVGVMCKKFSDCDGNPCRNGGHCVASGKGFVCNCPVEYRGLYCEADARLFYNPLPAVSSSNTIQRVEMATLLGVMLCGLIASVLIIGCFIGVMCEKRKLPRGEGDEAANSFWTDAAKALVQKTEGSGDSSSKESTDDEDGARDPNKLRSILKNGRQRNDIGGGTVTKSVGSRDFWDIA